MSFVCGIAHTVMMSLQLPRVTAVRSLSGDYVTVGDRSSTVAEQSSQRGLIKSSSILAYREETGLNRIGSN